MSKVGYTLTVTTRPKARFYRYRWELRYQHPAGSTLHERGFTVTRKAAIVVGHIAYWRKRVNLPPPKEVYRKLFKEAKS